MAEPLYNIGDRVIHIDTAKEYVVNSVEISPYSVEGVTVAVTVYEVENDDGVMNIVEEHLRRLA